MRVKDEYGDIPGWGGTRYATMDTVLPEKAVHVQGTARGPGGRFIFHLFNPPFHKTRMVCGICKRDMSGYRHCPYCYSEEA